MDEGKKKNQNKKKRKKEKQLTQLELQQQKYDEEKLKVHLEKEEKIKQETDHYRETIMFMQSFPHKKDANNNRLRAQECRKHAQPMECKDIHRGKLGWLFGPLGFGCLQYMKLNHPLISLIIINFIDDSIATLNSWMDLNVNILFAFNLFDSLISIYVYTELLED